MELQEIPKQFISAQILALLQINEDSLRVDYLFALLD